MSWLRNIIDHYVYDADIQERKKMVLDQLAQGKAREAHQYARVASATGDKQAGKQAREAREESEKLRQRATEIGVRVLGRDS